MVPGGERAQRTAREAMSMEKVNLAEKLACFTEHWSPRIVGELNGQEVRLVKVQGEFLWHHHEGADEMFLVLQGRLAVQMPDRTVELEKGEFFIVPRGVEHRTAAKEEAHILIFAPTDTVNTGNVRNERTVEGPERV
jgi:mannose-6-phosphate isomerase-like protein (cupin superfamily)